MLDLLPDLFDEFADSLTLLQAPWRQYGGKTVFYGQVVTVSCYEDNSRVKELLATPGYGRVLLVDGGGSTAKALLGDMIAQSAVDQGWSGVVIMGAVRDVGTLMTLPLGVQALGHVPIKTERRGVGEAHCPVVIAGVAVSDGHWLYADSNGIAVSKHPLPVMDLN